MGTGLMRKIDGICFSWTVRIVLRVGDSKVSACELRTPQKGRGHYPLVLRIEDIEDEVGTW